jgi:alpha-glucosidase
MNQLHRSPSWHASIHHDGSDLYVSNPYPRLGEKVRLRLRVDAKAPIRQAYLRTFPDGEQAIVAMTRVTDEPPAAWWEAELAIVEPVVQYRFILASDEGVWHYSANGPSAHDPLDAFDFRLLADYQPPAWVHEAVFYQIFPDRFANGDPANDPQPGEYEFRGNRPQTYPWGSPPPAGQHVSLAFYGGDLQGIRQRLDYIESLGINALYLTPVFKAYSNHKYDVIDYEHVDPHFGGDEALSDLRRALDERGMRYILDIVPNHCGYWHPWFQAACQDPAAPEAEFFTFDSHPDGYLSWLGVWTLPKLNYQSQELRRRIYQGEGAVFRRWLQPPFSADGWRVDVANMLARQGASQLNIEIARGIRRAVKDTNSQAYLIGENFFDATNQLQGDQWDGVMNYMGLATPLLRWLRGYQQGAHGLSHPIIDPQTYPTAALEALWRERRAVLPWAVALQQYNLLNSHDTPRIRSEVRGNDALHRLATIVLATYPGVPDFYYGDEVGMVDLPHLGPRGCMVWEEERWDRPLLEFHRRLIGLRRRSSVLQQGGFQMLAVEPDAFAYQRHSRQGRMIVIAQRAPLPRPAGLLPVAHGGIPDGARFVEVFTGQEAVVQNGSLSLPGLPQGGSLWEQVGG